MFICCGVRSFIKTLMNRFWLGVFENRTLKKIFQIRKEEMVREWKKLHYRALRHVLCDKHYYRNETNEIQDV